MSVCLNKFNVYINGSIININNIEMDLYKFVFVIKYLPSSSLSVDKNNSLVFGIPMTTLYGYRREYYAIVMIEIIFISTQLKYLVISNKLKLSDLG